MTTKIPCLTLYFCCARGYFEVSLGCRTYLKPRDCFQRCSNMTGWEEGVIEGKRACRRHRRRVCTYIQGANGPAGPLPLYSFTPSTSTTLQRQKKHEGHKSPSQRSVALTFTRVNKIKVSNTVKIRNIFDKKRPYRPFYLKVTFLLC